MDLFQVARDNAAALSHRYGAVRDAADAAAASLLDGFVAAVERDGRLAVNRRQAVLLRFLDLGVFHNLYEETDELARHSGRPREELLRERLKAWYDRRVAFDRFLGHGERLRYGALNLGPTLPPPGEGGKEAPAQVFLLFSPLPWERGRG